MKHTLLLTAALLGSGLVQAREEVHAVKAVLVGKETAPAKAAASHATADAKHDIHWAIPGPAAPATGPV